jgi:subtilisin family serine protease
MTKCAWVAFSAVLFAAATVAAVAADAEYSYFYQGKLIVKASSRQLIALPDVPAVRSLQPIASGEWTRNALSDRPELARRRISVFSVTGTRPKGAPARNDAASAVAQARAAGIDAQPVFEDGDFLTIAGNEVIVAFDRSLSLEQARRSLGSYGQSQGVTGGRVLYGNTFIFEISNPGGGRAFAASRALSLSPGVRYAEPNLIRAFVGAPAPLRFPKRPTPDPSTLAPLGDLPAPSPNPPVASLAVPAWTTVLTDGFEGTSVFGSGHGTNAIDAVPAIVTGRAHSGTHSVYMTGGGTQGIPAPGPYPNNCYAYILSNTLDLSTFEEVYVEAWFYAKYEEVGPEGPYDFGDVFVHDGTNVDGEPLAVMYTGDLTADPTTAGGWRRVLYRVPPAFRKANVRVGFDFGSDDGNGAEGLYVDDVRVVGTADVDANPISTDPYSARQYELKNSGQSAGLGNDQNDMNIPEAWDASPVSANVVVAVIDSGVELDHPDLNLVTGYDGDTGDVGGAPRTADDNHGQSCAGNVGALRNNGIGVAGTAAGVKIMPIFGGDTTASLANSFHLAVDHGAKVTSNSWGGGDPAAVITDAIQYALDHNVTVLFAAGNGPDRPPWSYNTIYPCNLTATTDVICVGASSPTDEHKSASSSDGKFSWGSSYVGAGPDVVAPGPWSYTTDRQGAAGYNADAAVTGVDANYTHSFSGTSSSTPKVAGVVALMLSKNPSLTPAQVKNILRSTAKDIDATGVDDKTGAGRVDALAAVHASQSNTFTLTVVLQGAGHGTVKSTPAGIDCSNTGGNQDCSEAYGDGTAVALAATAAAGSQFAGFSGDADCADGSVTVNANKTCNAAFNPTGQAGLAGDCNGDQSVDFSELMRVVANYHAAGLTCP